MLEDDGSTRVMTLNMWHNDVEVPARLSAAAEEIAARGPEVLCLQEVRFRPDGSNTAVELSRMTGIPVVAAAPVYRIAPDGTMSGLAILSALPVLSDQRVLPLPGLDAKGDPRAALAVAVESPAGRPFLVSTVHLAWGAVAEAVRLKQVVALDEQLDRMASFVPDGVTVLAGDLNSLPGSDTLGFLRGARVVGDRSTHWVDIWDVVGDGPGPTSGPGNPWAATTARESGILDPSVLPDRRIDYILVRGYAYGRPGHPITARIAFAFPATSDHWGVETELWDPPVSH